MFKITNRLSLLRTITLYHKLMHIVRLLNTISDLVNTGITVDISKYQYFTKVEIVFSNHASAVYPNQCPLNNYFSRGKVFLEVVFQ